MKKYNKKPNIFLLLLGREKGFSLVEIMVAAGMLGVVSLGVMQMTKNMSSANKKIKQDFEAQTTISEVLKEITDAAACRNTFAGTALNGNATFTGLNQIRDKSNANMIAVGDNLGRGSGALMHVEFIGIRGYVANPPTDPITFDGTSHQPETIFSGGAPTVFRRGQAQVTIRFRKGDAALNDEIGGTGYTAAQLETLRGSSAGGLEFQRTFTVEVLADNANVIQECYSNQNQYVEAACAALNGDLDTSTCVNMIFANDNAPSAPLGGAITDPQRQQYAFQAHGNVVVKPQANPDYGAPTSNTAGSFSVGMRPNTDTDSNVDIFGSLGVGADAVTNPQSNAEPGSLDVYRGAAILGAPGTDAAGYGVSVGFQTAPSGQGNLLVTNAISLSTQANEDFSGGQGTIFVENSAGIGLAPPTGNAGDLFVADQAHITNGLGVGTAVGTTPAGPGDARINNSLSVGPVAPDGNAGNLRVALSASIGSAAAPPNVDGNVRIQGAGAVARVGVGVAPATTGTQTVAVGAANTIVIGGNAANGSSGLSIVIPGMASYATESSGGNLGSSANEVPTKQWVIQAIANVISNSADLSQIISEISGYISSNPLDGIKANVCGNTILNLGGTPITGSYSTGTGDCTFTGTVGCGQTLAGRCTGTFYVTNLDISGTSLHSGTATFNGNLNANARIQISNAHLRVTGAASGYGHFDSYVRAARFCIGGTSGTSCLTQLRSACGVSQFAIGWYNGRLQCQTLTIGGI